MYIYIYIMYIYMCLIHKKIEVHVELVFSVVCCRLQHSTCIRKVVNSFCTLLFSTSIFVKFSWLIQYCAFGPSLSSVI